MRQSTADEPLRTPMASNRIDLAALAKTIVQVISVDGLISLARR